MISLAWEGDWPISQLFGSRPEYYGQFGLAGHEGVDVAMPVGTRLRALVDGEVVEVGLNTSAYGFYVKLRTPAGEDWLWAHMEPYELPRPGTWLPAGAPLGLSGSSGRIQGVHLHIAYRPMHWVRGWPYNGFADPLPLLPASSS